MIASRKEISFVLGFFRRFFVFLPDLVQTGLERIHDRLVPGTPERVYSGRDRQFSGNGPRYFTALPLWRAVDGGMLEENAVFRRPGAAL